MITLQELALAVKRLQARHHRDANARLADVGLSIAQWDVLRHLAATPDASLHDLAVLTFQTDPSMGTMAARMQARSLIERLQGPGRAVRHRLTEDGEAARKAGSVIMDAVFSETVGTLSAKDRQTLHTLLLKAAGTP